LPFGGCILNSPIIYLPVKKRRTVNRYQKNRQSIQQSTTPTTKVLSRHEKEMGIQIAAMDDYKWCRSQDAGHDVGKRAYFDWTQRHGQKVREWLESKSDEEINQLFEDLSDRIKQYILNKVH